MNDATSLDRLHDLVEPAPVSWWPLAPGWYVLMALVAVGVAFMSIRFLKQWQANAYRRQAIRELQAASSTAEIAEIIRRTALSFSSRTKIASLTGQSWVDWIEQSLPPSMTGLTNDAARKMLGGSVYAGADDQSELTELKRFAQTWVSHHRRPVRSHQQANHADV